MKTLYLIRGVPGSGKSTFAESLGVRVCEADKFFVDCAGVYRYDASQIKRAHEMCQESCEIGLLSGLNVAVANTFTRRWEMLPYYALAKKHGYQVHEIVMNGKFDNVHGVPSAVIKRMRENFEF